MNWVEVPFQVQTPQHGLRVDAFLAQRLHRYSRRQVQRLIEDGKVFLRGKTAKSSTRVAEGQPVLIRYPRREEPPSKYESLPVIYEDNDLLAVNKPGDMLSHPTDKIVLNAATSILRRQFPGQKLHLVHRLDRETSGVLLLTKNPGAARGLTAQFYARRIQKEYLAIVAGKVPWESKIVDAPIGREGGKIKVRQAAGSGQAAVTEFQRLSANHEFSLIRALPKTGRLHQIRVHLASLGHPLLGDKLYTGSGELYLKAVRKEITGEDLKTLGAERQMLHAFKLSLKHPGTKNPLTLTAPLPADFLSLGVTATGLEGGSPALLPACPPPRCPANNSRRKGRAEYARPDRPGADKSY